MVMKDNGYTAGLHIVQPCTQVFLQNRNNYSETLVQGILESPGEELPRGTGVARRH